MERLVDQALDAIRSADPQVVDDGIRVARSFFEHSHGQAQGLDRPEVVNEPANADDLGRLREALMDLVRRGPEPAVAGSAVFTLGKAGDPGLIGFFTQVIRDYLHGDAGVLYQAMIALDNLGANVFAGRRAMSVREEDVNRALATDFVRRADQRGR